MRKIDRRIVIVAALVFTIGLAYGLMKFLIEQKESPQRLPPVEAKRYVKAREVKYETIVSPVSAPGRLSSISKVDIIAEASGKIEKGTIPLKKGARFSEGDLLFTIYPDEASLALKARKSQFLNTLANLLPDLQVDYPDEAPVFKEFFNAIHLDKPLPQLPVTTSEQIRIFLASRNILSEYYGIRKDELQLSRHSVRAPFNGTYTDVIMEAGAYANVGSRVAHAIQTDILELEVPLSTFDAQWVKIGDEVTVTSNTRKFEWKGQVIRKNLFVDENTQSQGIFVRLKNHTKATLLAGEYLIAHFPGHPVQNAMEMERNAVFNSNEVFTIIDGRLKKRTIHIIKVNESTLIFNGLNERELLVEQPLINVSEGTMVEVLGKENPSSSALPRDKNPEGKKNKKNN
ncbi:MAG: HlyD family efflux transporter periplasmic adaptor subunit [Bacteroidales bacterium]|nr:HlyD family efflux transporter periplasmic adaptor subunit [Bacteroidales bacterium]